VPSFSARLSKLSLLPSVAWRAKDEEKPFLEQLPREGAKQLLQVIENEVIDYIQFHKDRRDENGQRLVVRNPGSSATGPAHRDKGRFSSGILPKYMCRTPSVDALIPALYLKESRPEISAKP
jgi:hypothetical protein